MMSATIFFSALVTTTFAVAAQPEARFSIKVADKFGAIDVTGKVVIEPQYDNELKFSDGLARVWFRQRTDEGSTWGYIHTKGKLVWRGQ